jgi:tetratricopeptide (TPR) repeat protein
MGVAPGLLAPLYDRNGRFVEAEEAARATLAVDSTLAVQHHVLSRALAAQGRFAEAFQARLAAIRNGEGGHWEQWGWLAELELALGDTAGARAALDSARLRGSSPSVSRQIDSFFVGLGLLSIEPPLPESARNSQNPRSEGGIP